MSDFNDGWKALTPRQYLHRAAEILDEARELLGIEIRHIVFTTDEKDPAWRSAANSLSALCAWLPLRAECHAVNVQS